MEGLRSIYTMDKSQMNEWEQICKAFAKKMRATLIFVNETSCGIELQDGTFRHIYINEMMDALNNVL